MHHAGEHRIMLDLFHLLLPMPSTLGAVTHGHLWICQQICSILQPGTCSSPLWTQDTATAVSYSLGSISDIQGEPVRLKRLRQDGYFENIFRFQRFNPHEEDKMGAKEHFLLKPLKKFQSHATGLTWIRNCIVLVYQRNDAQSDMSFSLLNKSHKSEKSAWPSLISVLTANPASALADESDS